MAIPTHITVEMLEKAKACPSGVAAFRQAFGDSAAFVPGNVYQFFCEQRRRGGFKFLLGLIDSRRAHRIRNFECAFHHGGNACNCEALHHGGNACNCEALSAAALCRLARQNLPKRKGK